MLSVRAEFRPLALTMKSHRIIIFPCYYLLNPSLLHFSVSPKKRDDLNNLLIFYNTISSIVVISPIGHGSNPLKAERGTQLNWNKQIRIPIWGM